MSVCGQIISVCNSERIIKIGQYLQKLCSNEKGSRFLLKVYVNIYLSMQIPILVKFFLNFTSWQLSSIISAVATSAKTFTINTQ